MAWSNGFGALAPNSQVVKSDQEILDPIRQNILEMSAWRAPTYEQNWLSAAPQFATATGLSLDGARGYLGGANSPFVSDDDRAFYRAAVERLAPAAGVSGFYDYNQQQAQDANTRSIWDAQKALDDKTAQLQRDTKRQTDAFGQMQGGNYFGGMLTEGYSEPTGMGPGGMPGNPTATPGAETSPFATYNASWVPEAKQRRAGSWGSAFSGW